MKLTVYKSDNQEQLYQQSDLALEIQELSIDLGFSYRHIHFDSQALNSKNTMIQQFSEHSQLQNVFEQYGCHASISLDSSFVNYPQLRQRYLSEHWLEDEEAFVIHSGRMLLSLHIEDKVVQLICGSGDYIEVPGKVKRWIDFGNDPFLQAVKSSNHMEGQIFNYTGNNIADRYKRLS